MTLSGTLGEIHILDYSMTHMVAIDQGLAKIQDGDLKLIHFIDIQQYENFLTEINKHINTLIPNTHSLYPLLAHELVQALEILETIKPTNFKKQKRALDFIGTAWKYIAGNPDHEDFQIISSHINNVLENNNKQVTINKLYNDRINNLTVITNELSNFIKRDNRINNEVVLSIQYRLRLVKEELTNIKFAIQWAKNAIINSMLLSKSEVKIIIDTFQKENLPFNTVEEALEIANINILTNTTTLLYIIRIPLTLNKTYEKLLLKPVKRGNVAVNLMYNTVLRHENEIFGITNNCKQFNKITICKQSQLIDLSNETCIPRLLKSENATCSTTNNQHIPVTEELEPGIILLNQFDGNIEIDQSKRRINGTFLIKFVNTTIQINNQLFKNLQTPRMRISPATLQPTPLEKSRLNILSLEALSELHINNTKEISLLNIDTKTNQWLLYAVITISIIFTTLVVICNKNKKTIIIEQVPDESNHIKINPSIPIVKTDVTEAIPRTLTFPNIYTGPFF